ncbi:MAG TPA: class III lanthionine synthetase LanKC [Candidatus Angelobacter sp.]|jgi:serine/threonine protein kinase|nr:class III lanthionine synthetase LanKC [Candidatus Angelobacter sp.]
MRSRPNPIYRLLNKDYPETFDSYTPDKKDFHDVVSAKLPAGWEISRRDIWFHCSSGQNAMPLQGWKIHISATLAHAHEIIDRVSAILLAHLDTNFKFVLDVPMLSLLNGKNWSRGGSGKFITIYPPGNARFLELIEEIHVATNGLTGPYILSDHRYKDSNVVYYRYGGMRLYEVLNIKGERTPMLLGPGGLPVPDQRCAYPVTPSWVDAPVPFNGTSNEGEDGHKIGNGRYTIETVVGHSNAGGVYKAFDQLTNTRVIIKEARPHVSASSDGYDAIDLLKKEHRLLCLLSDTGISPRPVDLFQEWEHWFLVEEYIEGTLMSNHSAAHNVLLSTRPEPEDYQRWYGIFRKLCISLARISDILQSRNIVFADLSTYNLIVASGKNELKVIDFEAAYQPGIDPPSSVYTPGFTSPERLSGGTAGFEDDRYSVGAVLMAYLFPFNGLFHLKPHAKAGIMAAIQQDARLPLSTAEMILDLLGDDPTRRPTPADMSQVLQATPVCCGPTAGNETQPQDGREIIEGILTHIHNTANYTRRDRLFPSDPKLFATNPLSVAHGVAGVAYAEHRITGKLPQSMINWIMGHSVSNDTYPPGLYMGTSGIAWTLLEMGDWDEAARIFRLSSSHPLLHDSADLFYGLSGWGMAALRFFLETENESYLDQAIQAGRKLLETSSCSERGRCWGLPNKATLGLAHGASGIGLFLLYLYLATDDEQFYIAGREALEFDLSFAQPTRDHGLSWSQSAEMRSPLYPYWRLGSAGVGMATLRFYRLLQEPRYLSILEKIFIDTDRKYAVLPGVFMGLSGIGEFLLDMHDVFGGTRYLQSAHKAAQGIMNFRVDRAGIAFPGEMLSRLSCDYGTGSAGIALFLNRLQGHQIGNFMLDALFQKRGLGEQSLETESSVLLQAE